MAPTIEADGLAKRYALGEREQYLALRDVITSTARRLVPRRSSGSDSEASARRAPAFRWALDDGNLCIAPGEVVGIGGTNGAGKSTLLKLISSITRPTRGSVRVRGRVGTLLEVGSGFHPELTGAENIFLNGAILGMRRAEIRANFDDIVEFSGVSAALDTPVKRYSTGMYMRLAFAVAAHLDTEVLLVDEVLAVGDAAFRRKCIGRMRELAQSEGRTVLFVSHDDNAIRQLCPRAIWLDTGRVRSDGPAEEVLTSYLDEQFRRSALGAWIDLADAHRSGSGEARFERVRLEVPGRASARTLTPGDPLTVQVSVRTDHELTCGNLEFYISTLGGLKVVSAGSDDGGTITLPAGVTDAEIVIDTLHLNPGRYTGSLWLARPTGARRKFGLFDHLEDVVDIVVVPPCGRDAPSGLVATESELHLLTGDGSR